MATATVLLAACGSGGGDGSGPSAGGSLDIYISSQPNFPAAFAAWSKDISAKFKARTGADLTIETYASSADETTKIQTSVVSGTGPDVYQLGTTFTPVASATGAFATLSDDDWTRIGGRDTFIPAALGMSGPDKGKQIGVPGTMAPFSLVYNTEMFAAAGITAPPTTWDEFVKVATRLTDPAKGVHGAAIDYGDGFSPWKYVLAMSEQSGGNFVSPDLKTAGLNSPQTLAATTAYFDLLTRYHLSDPASVGWKSGDATAAFAAGKAAMLPMQSAATIPTLDKSPVKGKYAFASMPTVAPGMTQRPPGATPAASIVSGQNYGIASYTDHKDLALAFVAMMSTPEQQQANYAAFGQLPTNRQAMADLGAKNPLLAPFLQIENDSTPTPFTGAWGDTQNGMQNVVTQSLPALARGGYDPAAVRSLLDAANAKAQSALDRANR